MIMDASVSDDCKFADEYASKSAELFRKHDISVAVVATPEVNKLKGLWDPNYTVVHFIPDRDAFIRLLESGNKLIILFNFFNDL